MDNILDLQDENKDYLSELVGEGKKYKDPQDLAKAYYHADRTIEVFKPRMDELREENTKLQKDALERARLEELINKFESITPPAVSNTPAREDVKPTIDLNELDARFDARITQREVERQRVQNAFEVQAKLKERFGDQYSRVVREQIADLGWTEDEFNQQARRSPKATLRALGADQTPTESFQAPVRGQSSFGSKAEPKKTWTYYQDLKRTNPKLYHDPKITNEMIAMAERLGDAFKDGDYARFND